MGSVMIPNKHKAAIYDKPGEVSTKVVEVDTPEPGPGEVLVNLTHSGVCHSDYAVMTNGWKVLPFPTAEGQVGGHEGVGTIAKLGSGAEANLKVGDRVGIKWLASTCGGCACCHDKLDAGCSNAKISGYYTPGTFQQYVLGPANYVTPIPEGVDSAEAAPLLCAGITCYSALLKAGAKPGTWVVISGAGGGLGHLACQLASRALGMRVIGIDHVSKHETVMKSGAEHFIDMARFGTDEELTSHVQSLTGGVGAHAVVVCTSSNRAYSQAVDLVRFNGVVVCVGITEGNLIPIATAFPSKIAVKQLRVVGSAVGNQKEAVEVLDFAARGIIKAHVEVKKLEDLTQVFHDMHAAKLQGRVVLDLS